MNGYCKTLTKIYAKIDQRLCIYASVSVDTYTSNYGLTLAHLQIILEFAWKLLKLVINLIRVDITQSIAPTLNLPQEDSLSTELATYNTPPPDPFKLSDIWLEKEATIRTVICPSAVNCIQFDLTKVVSGHDDWKIRMWALDSLECVETLNKHQNPVLCLKFNEKVLVSGDSGGVIYVWDIQSNKNPTRIRHDFESISGIGLINDTAVSLNEKGFLFLWNIESTDGASPIIIKLRAHDHYSSAFHINNQFVVTGSDDQTVKVWKSETLELVCKLVGHEAAVNCVFCLDRIVVSGGEDRTIRVWNVDTKDCLRVLETIEKSWCVGCDDEKLVSGFKDGQVVIWDTSALFTQDSQIEIVPIKTFGEHSHLITSVTFDDKMLVTTSKNSIVLYQFS